MLIATCPKCKREIPLDAPRNLCPYCLLDTALQPSDAILSAHDNGDERRYLDEEEISRGGMGRILLVRDEHLGRSVVLKQLLPETKALFVSNETVDNASSPYAACRRFVHEAQVTGRLEHPSIVPVYDLGHYPDGTPYYTMRYVRGSTMADRLMQCQSLDDRMALLSNYLNVCQGIAYAHSKGVIHRDIKPANILVGEFGETVIIDWGLAKSVDEPDVVSDKMDWPAGSNAINPVTTRPGYRLGTPFYMSPEQVNSKISSIDQRTDVFALGIVLYQILTGHTPIEDGQLESIYERIVHEVPRRPTAHDRKIPRELETICMKALEKTPARRYQTAQELALDVERFLTGALVQAYSYTALERVRRLYRAYRVPAQLLAMSLLVLAIVGTVAFVRIQDARNDALRAWTNEKSARSVAENERYHALISLARHQIESDGPESAEATLLSVGPSSRDWEWWHLFNVTQQSTTRLNGLALIRISPDGKLLAGVGPGLPLAVWTLDDFQQRFTTDAAPDPLELRGTGKTSSQISTFEFDETGRYVITATRDGKVRVYDIIAGTQIANEAAGTTDIVAMSLVSPYVVCISAEGELSVFALEGLRLALVNQRNVLADVAAAMQFSSSPEFTLSVSSDGLYIAVGIQNWGSARGVVWVRRLSGTTGEIVSTDGSHPFIAADHRLVFQHGNGITVKLLDTSDAIELSVPAETVIDAAPLSRGNLIAALTQGGYVYGWPIAALSRTPTRLATASPTGLERGILSIADDHFAVFSDEGPFRVFDATKPLAGTEFAGKTGVLRSIVFDRFRNRLITTANDYHLRTWDLANSQPAQTIFTFPDWALGIEFLEKSNTMVIGGGDDAPLVLVDATTFEMTELMPSLGHVSHRVTAISSDENLLVTTVNLNTAKIFDLKTRKVVANLSGHKSDITTLAFSDDNQRILTSSLDGTLRIWDSATGDELRQFSLAQGITAARWIQSESRILAVTNSGLMVLWDMSSGTQIVTNSADGSGIDALLVLEKDNLIITGSVSGLIRRWRTSTLDPLQDLVSGGNGVSSFAISPDRNRLISGHRNGDIKVWDAHTWREIVTLHGHRGVVRDLQFVQDGTVLVSTGGLDGYVRAWRAQQQTELP